VRVALGLLNPRRLHAYDIWHIALQGAGERVSQLAARSWACPVRDPVRANQTRSPALGSGLWGCFRCSCASANTPAGCLLQLVHGMA
jgi:hypothetical protein